MVALVITILRYLFLILLYLFIFRLTASMLDELRQAAKQHRPAKDVPIPAPPVAVGGDGARLKVITAGEEPMTPGDSFRLGELTRLGRGPGNHIAFTGAFASQEHAQIVFRQGQYWLEDLGSLNQTYLNEMPVKRPTVLANGDRIRIGDVIFQFVRWAYEMESDN
ncbi:FHA domain-containing protein [Desulfotomaculum nigrificans]|uniref:FHA domain-containing protein n=1 Tax=Desulfotomaculum nigrificans TaxID=1565 RepID=UPI0001FAEC6D|nr:FHA domain-containing protein [Desulfotomaculum nigrificans]